MSGQSRLVIAIGILSALLAGPAAAQVATAPPQQTGPPTTTGTVFDVSGAVIPAATVEARTKDGRAVTVQSDGDGRFDTGVQAERLRVTSEGFDTVDVTVTGTDAINVVLRPVNFADTVVVTATRGAERLPSAASSTVITAAELSNMAAGSLDDALRSTPGFTLFRRSSSRVANPTTQGVTLRGVSGSGASRTLVLADGVPLNDPFGSWVYWNRIPQAAVDRVEVVRGATGDLYGAGALGGVVQLLTVQPSRTRARATIDGGSHDTFRGSMFVAAEKNGWAATGAYEGVRTDGAFVVGSEVRNPVTATGTGPTTIDTKADSDYHTGFFSAGRRRDKWHATLRGAGYAEERGNGTPVQVNTTDWKQVSLDVGGVLGGGVFQLQAAGASQDYYQTFSAVAAGRLTERLTFAQSIDTQHRMVNGQWTRNISRVTMIVGADYRYTDSLQDELRYALVSGVNTESGPFVSGGIERVGAVYARANVTATDSLTLEVGARGDAWRSEPADAAQPPKSINFFSPRGAVAWRRGRYSVQASAYHASRTPSLNELHRRFAAGNAVTNANPELEPETLNGVEGGVLAQFNLVSIRATAFMNNLEGAIANVTLTSTPAQIIRQRQNSDQIQAQGVEMELDARLTNTLSLNGQVVLTSSHFRGSKAAPAIADNKVPQVPKWQGGFGVTWADPRWLTAATQVRFSGEQFDDDLNTPGFVLGSYVVMDVNVSRAITRGLNAFVAVENVTDEEFDTARTPIRSVGWPRTIRAGARISWQ